MQKIEQTTLGEFGFVIFDGHEDPKSMEYISECDGGGISLNVYKIGDYYSCNNCKLQEYCKKIRPKQKT